MIITTTLAGLNFRPAEAKIAVDNLDIGDKLTLIEDFENPYDSNAVQVVDPKTSEFIGFIPKSDNFEIALAIRNKSTIAASIVGWEGTRKPTIKVVIDEE